MTAEEWAACADPEEMLTALDDAKFSTSRLPVVLAGFAERGRLVDLLSSDLRQQFVGYARWVFGLSARPLPIELPVFDPLAPQGIDVWDADESVQFALTGRALTWFGLSGVVLAEAQGTRRVSVTTRLSRSVARLAQSWHHRQADALRDALGNPFTPVTWEPGWRSETAVALARGIHFDNAFDRLPILADALEEAGCDHPDILSHCRGPGPHARGCWVVDGVMGKV